MNQRIALVLAVILPWAGSSPAWAMVARVPAAVGVSAPLAAAVGAGLRGAAPILATVSGNPGLVLSLVSQRYGTDPSPHNIADLGEGDYGEVRSGMLGQRAVAVKIPYLDPGGMIRHEAAVAERLRDAGGADLFVQAAEDPELGVLVMEKLEGYQNLGAWLDERRTVKLRSFKRIARQLLKGLDVLEAAGLVHSDLRPSNIMVGPGLRVKVIDFGIAAPVGGYVPYPDYEGWRGGHHRYTSPNQLGNGPAAFVDDRHAVGVVLGELSGKVPGLQGGAALEPAPLDREPLARSLRESIARLTTGDTLAELANLEKLAYSTRRDADAEGARVLLRMLADPQLIVQSRGFIRAVGLKNAEALHRASRFVFQSRVVDPGLIARLSNETARELDEALPAVDKRTRRWFLEPSGSRMRELPSQNGTAMRQEHRPRQLMQAERRGAGARNFGLPGWVRVKAPEKIGAKALKAATGAIEALRGQGPRVLTRRELDTLHPGRAAASNTLTGRRKRREHANFRAAAELVNERVKDGRDLDLDFLQELSAILLGGTGHWREAGRLRGFENGLDLWNDRRVSFAVVEHLLSYLGDFMRWYDANKAAMHPLELAAKSYQQLVRIHPVINTNGRTGRLIADFILQRGGFLPAVYDDVDSSAVTDRAGTVAERMAAGVAAAAAAAATRNSKP